MDRRGGDGNAGGSPPTSRWSKVIWGLWRLIAVVFVGGSIWARARTSPGSLALADGSFAETFRRDPLVCDRVPAARTSLGFWLRAGDNGTRTGIHRSLTSSARTRLERTSASATYEDMPGTAATQPARSPPPRRRHAAEPRARARIRTKVDRFYRVTGKSSTAGGRLRSHHGALHVHRLSPDGPAILLVESIVPEDHAARTTCASSTAQGAALGGGGAGARYRAPTRRAGLALDSRSPPGAIRHGTFAQRRSVSGGSSERTSSTSRSAAR